MDLPSAYGKPISVRLTRSDLIAFNLLLTPRLPGTWIVWTTIALWVAISQSLQTDSPVSTTRLVASAIVAVIAATAVLFIGLVVSLLFVLVTSSTTNGVLGEHLYSFGLDGLREQTSANDSVLKWRGARDVRRVGAFISISVSPGLAHVLPRRCFASLEDFDAFWQLAQGLKSQAG